VDNNIKWGKVSQINSSFNIAEEANRFDVWGIVQARILSDGSGSGGFCGTAWLCKVTEECLIFATAAHVVSTELFYSVKNIPVKVYVFLSNANGISFPIAIDNVKIYREIDLAFITLPNLQINKFHPLSLSLEEKSCDEVYNYGFPDRAQNDVKFSINLNPLSATFDRGPWFQNGNISSSCYKTTNYNDVNLVNAQCFRLNYTSESGFSGGPLFSNNTNKVIGMMTMVVPTNDGSPPTESLAISVSEIIKKV